MGIIVRIALTGSKNSISVTFFGFVLEKRRPALADKKPENLSGNCRDKVVETKRIELSTSRMRPERSPS